MREVCVAKANETNRGIDHLLTRLFTIAKMQVPSTFAWGYVYTNVCVKKGVSFVVMWDARQKVTECHKK